MDKKQFIAELAEYLAGPQQVEMSIKLQLRQKDALLWARIRNSTPLFGYPSVEEAKEILEKWLL